LVDGVWTDLAGATTREQVDSAFGRVVKARAPKGPGWRDGAPGVPQRSFDLRIVDHYTPLIQRDLDRLYPLDALRVAAEARTLDLLPSPNTGPLEATLRKLWADSWATGLHGAQLQVDKVKKARKFGPDAEVSMDWDTWEPGDLDAAIFSADGAFADVLAEAGITIRGIAGTSLDRMGTILSEGLLDGHSVDKIARGLRGLLGGDRSRAEMIAHTETARLQTLGTFKGYREMGVTAWDWLTTTGACPRCVALEARNPHSIDESGPPAHPRCRCAPAPVWQTI
jgi:SPP1 gp7 family putative phage head morphogenesis protein